MTRVAAVDCGTNSLRLLIADVDDENLSEVTRRTEIVRLGHHVDQTGLLAPEALARTFTVLRDYAAEIDRAGGVERIRMVATSASRDAVNSNEFVAGVEEILGVQPDVITGAAEAQLSFTGALFGLSSAMPAPVLVVDVGGGSTELILGTSSPDEAVSTDIGSVRITERHFHADPPAPAQVGAADADIEATLDTAARSVDLAAARSVIGLGGSVTTLGAIHCGLTVYDRSVVHLTQVPADDVRTICARLLAATTSERETLSVIHPGRIDVIAAGVLITRHVLDRSHADAVVVSEHDLLDGIAVSVS